MAGALRGSGGCVSCVSQAKAGRREEQRPCGRSVLSNSYRREGVPSELLRARPHV